MPLSDEDVYLPFGRFSSGAERKPVHLISSRYLAWLLDQDWFEKKYEDLYEEVTWEMDQRDKEGRHFYD